MGCCPSKGAQYVDKKKEPGVSAAVTENAEKETVKTFTEIMDFIGVVPLFKRLPAAERPKLAGEFVLKKFDADANVIRQGEDGDEFFVIKMGQAQVSVQGEDGTTKVVATLKKGDYFGEGALLRNEPRNATINAAANNELLTLSLTRENFEKLGLRDKIKFARREAVAAVNKTDKGAETSKEPKGNTEKTANENNLVIKAIKSNPKLIGLLDEDQCASLARVAWRKKILAETEIIKEGDVFADHFYIVQSGTCSVYKAVGAQSLSDALSDENKIANILPGMSFGELALLYHAPRAATVVANEDVEVFVVERTDFKNICMQKEDQKTKDIAALVHKIELFTPLLSEERERMASCMVEVSLKRDEVIMEQGKDGDSFWLLVKGKVDIIKDGAKVNTLEADFKNSICPNFGESALLSNDVRSATITVASSTAKALVLDRESFNLTLGSLADLLKEGRTQAASGPAKPDQKGVSIIARPPKKTDLKKIGLLGVGGFGSVTLEKDRQTGNTYALKSISKGFIVKMDMEESVMNEKAILLMTDSPFIIKLYATYNTPQYLLFLIECALGGELFSLYHRKNLHGKEDHARYYSACVILGFEHLHERRIIYRDLKPENLLLDDKGVCKITDMGLAKFVIGKTFTTCGTPDYFAPEIITATGHNRAVDWWALGILIFELMTCHPPFETSDPMLTYKKIMQGINSIKFPRSQFNEACEELVVGLCKKDPSERLPMRKSGLEALQQSKWYKEINWEQLAQLKVEVPFKPRVKSISDCTNYYPHEEDMPPHIPYVARGQTWDKGFATVDE